MMSVVRQVTRRAALGIVGAGLAAATGVSTRPVDCRGAAATSDCGGALALVGPDRVSLGDANPRFTLSNEADAPVTLAPDSWSVYRTGEEWRHVDSGDAGRAVTLDGDSTLSYLLLVDADTDGPGTSTTETTTTRYVGPVALDPGTYAFVVTGRRDGSRTSVGARFEVTE